MFEVLGDLLPIAVAIALSPFPVIAIVLVLSTPKAGVNGTAFALGWVAGLGAAATLVLLLAGGSDEPGSTAAQGVSWVRVLLGVALLALAVRKWRSRPRPGEESEMPGWMAHLDELTPGKAAGLGVLLGGVNPKNLALVIAGASAIAQAGLPPGEVVVDVVAFVLLASSTVAGAVLAHVVLGERSEAGLASVKQFMLDHNAAIMVVILLLFGLKLVGDGLAGV